MVGRNERNRILNSLGFHSRYIRRSRDRLRFADATYDSLGTISIPLRTTPGVPPILVKMDIVHADIPALLGLDVFDKESITPCVVSNRLRKRVMHKAANCEDVWIDE